MSSKVIIRIGPESEHVDRENLLQRTVVTYDREMTVVFANVDIYYVIITEEESIRNLQALIENEESDDDFTEKVKSQVRNMLSQYAESNFEEFTERVEKAIKTAHGIGVQKATNRVVNAANRFKGNRGQKENHG
ncbi:hypothetical protein PBI_SCTP2_127 [Salicola phage SCTP-2]|nr:hypothetical protein PBI_SCTP2_127 [Salicola phage SCTP-2]